MSKSLLQQVADGVDGAMDECLARYGGLVWSIARRLVGNSAEAEDTVQEIFLELWKSAKRFKESESSEKTFVAMIARRRAIDRLRAKKRRVETESLLDENESQQTDSVGKQLEVQEEAIRARELMTQLREDERTVLELAIDQGLSQSEIASQIGMPLGTVKSHARRGMLRLRDWLSEDSELRRANR